MKIRHRTNSSNASHAPSGIYADLPAKPPRRPSRRARALALFYAVTLIGFTALGFVALLLGAIQH